MEKKARRPGMSLIEVVISTVILGVVSIAYATTTRGQFAQREAYEDLAIAMEMCSRQIEYLRGLDVRKPKDGTAFGSPFSSVFNTSPVCPEDSITSVWYKSTTDLDFGIDTSGTGSKSVKSGSMAMSLEFLSSSGTYTQAPASLTKDGNSIILPEQYTVGLETSSRPRELWLPPLYGLGARNFSCVVRASRVKPSDGSLGAQGANPVNTYAFLLHFQVTVFRGQAGTAGGTGEVRRPIMVMNYLREADLL